MTKHETVNMCHPLHQPTNICSSVCITCHDSISHIAWLCINSCTYTASCLYSTQQTSLSRALPSLCLTERKHSVVFMQAGWCAIIHVGLLRLNNASLKLMQCTFLYAMQELKQVAWKASFVAGDLPGQSLAHWVQAACRAQAVVLKLAWQTVATGGGQYRHQR